MQVTIYTISNDQFCTAEKEYLTTKGIQFAEKNIESNREFLSEMLAASDNFSGVPFTIIVKDDGSTVKLKGFTKEEFESALSIIPAASVPAVSASAASEVPVGTSSAVVQPVASTPTTPPITTIPTEVAPTIPVAAPQVSPSTNGNGNVQKDLEGVLNTLSSMTDVTSQPSASTQATPQTPSIPATPTSDMPAVPDFSQKPQ